MAAKIAFIAAVAENYIIGRDGDLPWKLPADLRWFVEKTRGKPVISGRRTFESTGTLRSRKNIVVTTQSDYDGDCDVVAHSIDGALAAAGDVEEAMILGGATIYEELLERADRFYLTVIHDRPQGDTRFPAFSADQWEVTYEHHHAADEQNPVAMTFYILDRATYGPSDNAPQDLIPAAFR